MTALERQAPALRLELRANFIWRLLHAVGWGLAGLSLCATLAAQAQARELTGAWVWMLLLPCVLAGAALGWRLSRGETLLLRFDGLDWWLQPLPLDGQVGEDEAARCLPPRLLMDLGAWILLGLDPADGRRGARRWLAVSRRELSGQWLSLRCALLASARGRPARELQAPRA